MNIINKLTLRHMKLNKRRTLVTMIGIIISVAMITAVSTVGYSIMDFFARNAMESSGYFHFKFDNYQYKDNGKILEEFNVENYSLMQVLGDYVYEISENGEIELSPYKYDENEETSNAMRVIAVQDNYYDMLSVKLSEGTYPKNASEILLSEHMGNIYEGKHAGDKIIIGGTEYTISGIIGNMEFESRELELPGAWAFPVYTRLNVDELKENDIVGGYFYAGGVLDNIEDRAKAVAEVLQSSDIPESQLVSGENTWFCSGTNVAYNYNVLTYLGLSKYTNINNMMNSVKMIFIVIIMVGSISLIANGFIISISERSRYLGMLASVGATKKQKRGSVYFEGFVEGIVSIPLGILAGIAGIGITFKLLEPVVKNLSGNDIGLELVVNKNIIIWSVVFSVITIFLSAYIPARRASRIAPIDAIRQSRDVKITGKTVKTMGITRKIFGFEGDLALKNLKRNKKRYRVTVFSMFISLTLFLSVYSIVTFIKTGYESEMESVGYDIAFFNYKSNHEIKDEAINHSFEKITDKIMATDYIEEAERYATAQFGFCSGEIIVTDDSMYHKNYLDFIKKSGSGDMGNYYLDLVVMSDSDLKAYLKSVNIDYDDFVSDDNNIILFNRCKLWQIVDSSRYTYDGPLYSDELKTIDYEIVKYSEMEDGEVYNGENGQKINLQLNIYSSEEMLYGLENTCVSALITPNMADKLYKQEIIDSYYNSIYIKSENTSELKQIFYDELEKINDNNYYFDDLDFSESVKKVEDMLLLISVFAYGFIVLISLVCIANIVNTISTSLALRKREFAMLKSVGMTDRAFKKMIAYESGFYGIKALIFGLPVGTVIMLLVRNIIQNSMYMQFDIPWMGYLIAIVGVFIVISVTMLYAARKIKNENVIDVLKNENI